MRLPLVLVLLLLAVSSPLRAQSDYRNVVISQLDASSKTILENGFRQNTGMFGPDQLLGMLAPSTSSLLEISLEAGVSYFFTAVCDQDCTDLDLRLFRVGESDPVEQDVETDDHPMLTHTPGTAGRYLIAVDMASCSESWCYYGLRSHRK